MTKEDQNHSQAQINRPDDGDNSNKRERDAAAKAVLDNMARLKALRLAREANEPSRPAAASRKAPAKPKKSAEKTPALADWLAGRQSGGHRT
jgi:sarcosine oxidase gamma subunit